MNTDDLVKVIDSLDLIEKKIINYVFRAVKEDVEDNLLYYSISEKDLNKIFGKDFKKHDILRICENLMDKKIVVDYGEDIGFSTALLISSVEYFQKKNEVHFEVSYKMRTLVRELMS